MGFFLAKNRLLESEKRHFQVLAHLWMEESKLRSALTRVQDHAYLFETASRLHSIATGTSQEKVSLQETVERREAYFRILAWEIDLHDMFWNNIEEGESVFHPTLGRGRIIERSEKPTKREDYTAKLISVQFDCGQSCIFHSRVQNNERVTESLAEDVANALGGC